MDINKILNCHPTNADYFKKLKSDYQSGNIIPFFGAGISSGIYPLWGELLLDLADRPGHDIKDKIKLELDKSNFEKAASILKGDYGKLSFSNELTKIFSDSLLPPDLLSGYKALFPRLFPNSVLTSNFDLLLEGIYSQSYAGFDYVCTPHNFSDLDKVTKSAFGGSRVLFKMHGTIQDIHNLVLTEEEFDDKYGEMIDDSLPLVKALLRLLHAKKVLFIGCSLTQDRTTRIIKSISEEGYKQYAFLEMPEETENAEKKYDPSNVFESGTRRYKKEFKKRMQELDDDIYVMWYPYKQHECINILLHHLSQNQMSPQRFNDIDFQHEQHFIGRTELVDEVVEILSTREDEIINNLVVVVGEPGIGKTEFCKEVLIKTLKETPKCTAYYINLTGVTCLDDMAQRLAKKVNLISKNDYYRMAHENTRNTYFEYIFNKTLFFTRNKYLTIYYLDNFEDLLWSMGNDEREHVINWMKNICKRNSKIVLSSRGYDFSLGTVEELQPLSPEHAKELFTNNWNGDKQILEKANSDGSLAKLLTDELSNHPLAIVLTANQGKYVASFEGLVRNWRNSERFSLNARHKSLKTALKVSWDSIKNKEWARKIWGILSLFDEPIDNYLLENYLLPRDSLVLEHKNALISNNLISYKDGKLAMLNPIKGFCFEFDETDLLSECITLLYEGFCRLLTDAEEEIDKREKHNIVINNLSLIICFQLRINTVKIPQCIFDFHEKMESYYQYMPTESYELLKRLIQNFSSVWSERQMISLYGSIRGVCYLLDLTKEAKEYCRLALELCDKVREDGIIKGSILTSKASLMIREDETSDVDIIIEEAIKICERENNENGKANAIYSRANLKIQRKHISDAEKDLLAAKLLYLKVENNIGLGNVCRSLGDLKSKMNSKEAENFYTEAEKYYDIEIDLLGLANVELGRAKMYENINENYLSKKHYANALNYFKQTADFNNYACLLFLFGDRERDYSKAIDYYIEGIKVYEKNKKYRNCCLGTLKIIKIFVSNELLGDLQDALKQCGIFLKFIDDEQLKRYIKVNIRNILIQKGLICETGISDNCNRELAENIKDILVPNTLFLDPACLELIVPNICNDNSLGLDKTVDRLVARIDKKIAELNEKLEMETEVESEAELRAKLKAELKAELEVELGGRLVDVTFTAIDDEGNRVTYDVLFTFESEETGKHYIIYTDTVNKTYEEGNMQIYAGIFNPDDQDNMLEPIKTEEEWTMIEEILLGLRVPMVTDEISREATVKGIEDCINNIETKEQD